MPDRTDDSHGRDPDPAAEDEPVVLERFPPLERPSALRLLRDGELEIVGRLVNASNATLYCSIELPSPGDGIEPLRAACVYKPIRGEAPLWDFPEGTLAHREVAAHVVSEAGGWGIVPPTVFRDGPFGQGMVQVWIDVDESIDPVDLLRRDDPALRRMALFDAVVNNADRKVGHLLPISGGHVFGVDHGVCFSDDPKLRTVLWAWRGRRLTAEEFATLRGLREQLDGDLRAELGEWLSAIEIRATCDRIEELLATRRFPQPDPDRPAIPWPPY